MANPSKLNNICVKDIIHKYENGKSQSEIAREYKVTPPTIRYHLLKRGIDLNYQYNKRERKADKFFASNTNELLYFWGFVLGDGHISDSYMEISLDQKDLSTLEKFCDWLGYPRDKIKFYPRLRDGRPSNVEIYLCITNKSALKYAHRYGVVKNKTYFPTKPSLRNDEIAPFLLGLLDADGHIKYMEERKCGNYIRHDSTVSLVGNEVIVKWAVDCLHKLGYTGHMSFEQATKTGNSKRARTSRSDNVIELANLLNIKDNYKLCMKRKWKKIYKAII